MSLNNICSGPNLMTKKTLNLDTRIFQSCKEMKHFRKESIKYVLNPGNTTRKKKVW